MHINRKSCLISTSISNHSEFKNQYDSFKEGFRLEMGRKRKQKSRSNQIEKKGLEQVRKESNKNTLTSRFNQIEKKGLEQVRKESNKNTLTSRSNQIQKKGLKQVRKEETKRKEESISGSLFSR